MYMSQPVNLPTNTNKQNKKIWLIPGVILVIFIGIFGYYFYSEVFSPRQSIESINQNINSYNLVSDRSATLIKVLDTQIKGFDTSDESFESIKKSNQDSEDLIKEIDVVISKLSNSRTDSTVTDFYKSTITSLESIKSYLQSYNQYVEYNSCIIKNRATQINNFNLVATQIGQIDSFDPFSKENLEATKQVVSLTRANADLTGQIDNCFVGEFEVYNDNSVKQSITDTQKIFNNFADAYQGLVDGIESQDTSKLSQVKSVLEAVRYDQVPLFNEPFDLATLDQPNLDFGLKTEELSRIDSEYSDLIKNIKDKYNL